MIATFARKRAAVCSAATCVLFAFAIRRGGDEARFKEAGGRRTQAFLLANGEFRQAVLNLSKELRA